MKQGAAAATEAQYYQSQIAGITSVDDFLADDRLFAYALTAVGLDPSIASTTTIRNVLTSDLSDPGSVANTIGDNRYVSLAACSTSRPTAAWRAGLQPSRTAK